MKTLTLIGAIFGFGIGLGLGLLREVPLPWLLVRATLAAYVGAWLLRWWSKVWIKNFTEAAQKRTNVK